MNEKLIKCRLIDELLKKYPNCIIGTEIPFLAGKRWVDVLVVTDHELIAFEIKSKFDSLRRLNAQIKDYTSTFDRLNIIMANKFQDHVFIKNIPKKVGYAFIEQDKIVTIRNSIKNKRVYKKNLSLFLWKREIDINSKGKRETVDVLRTRFVKKHSVESIHQMAIKSLKLRYEERFKLFLREKSEPTHQEDLDYLTKTYNWLP